jgi:hydroxypyruvate reductase
MNQMLAQNQVWDDVRARQILRDLFDAAVSSAAPENVLAKHLPPRPKGRCVVVGAGKAAGAMAVAVEAAWPDVEISGVVVAPYGYGGKTTRIKMHEAAHPVPDANSEAAAAAILEAVKGLTADDLVLALISGGGSSVMSMPAPGLTLADKQATNRALLASGLDIRTMNVIRRRLSAIKGGKLAAAAAPARVVTLGISDIPGDDPAAIASGPTVPDTDAFVDVSAAIDLLDPRLPKVVVDRLRQRPAPPEPLRNWEFRMIATPAAALDAAAAVARAAGLTVDILGDDIEGEARDVGAHMALLARIPSGAPRVILSGGETTVTLEGSKPGRGGRNTEFLLALAHQLKGEPGVWGMAGDTDGEDGASGGAAGAIFGPDTLRRGVALGLDTERSLAAHDSGGYFAKLNDLVVTGPTQTNVNDFRAILVVPRDTPN